MINDYIDIKVLSLQSGTKFTAHMLFPHNKYAARELYLRLCIVAYSSVYKWENDIGGRHNYIRL